MEEVTEEMVIEVLKKMGYPDSEVDTIAKDEIRQLINAVQSMNGVMTVNEEEECPKIPDE